METSGTTSDNEQEQLTSSDSEWQRVTTIGTTTDNRWQQMAASGTRNKNEWKGMRASEWE